MDPRAKLYLLLLANLMLFFHVGTGAEAVATGDTAAALQMISDNNFFMEVNGIHIL
jgi:hypothetical protein